MTETKEILKKIAALRMRLTEVQAQALAARAPSFHSQREDGTATALLEEKVTIGAWQNTIVDGALRQIGGDADSPPLLPPKLTARGARVLTRGRELLQQLRDMLEDPLLRADDHDPLTLLHAEIASMLDVLLRTVQAFPPSASAQLRLCEGLEAAERLIEERLGVLNAALTHRRREVGRLDGVADTFAGLASGQAVNPQTILAAAGEIIAESRESSRRCDFYARRRKSRHALSPPTALPCPR